MPASSHNQPAEGGLRILHWNIHSWRDESAAPNMDAVIGLIRNTSPHVVSLVEVDEPAGTPSSLETVASSCGYAWIFAPAFEFGHGPSSGGFGNALLTKAPIAAAMQWRVFTPPGPYDGSEPSEPRSVVMAKLRLPSQQLWVGSTHLPRSDPGARTAAARRLTELTRRLDSRWIICGDFNAAPAGCFGHHHALTVAPDPPLPTHPAGQPDEPIDYLIATPGTLMEARVLPTAGSDHLPLLATAHLGLPGADPAAGRRRSHVEHRAPYKDGQ